MTDPSAPGSPIAIPSLHNLRDLGGWPLREGLAVRRGQVYRSAQLGSLDKEDIPAFEELAIRTVYDLRTMAERKLHPDVVPQGIEHVDLNVLGDLKGASGARLIEVFDMLIEVIGDIRNSEHDGWFQRLVRRLDDDVELGPGKTEEGFKSGYRQIVSRPSALEAYRRAFLGFAQQEKRPALFHCTTGKDRTGWCAAALLMFLGVSDQDVMDEYLLTNRDLLPAMQRSLDRFASAGGDPDRLRPFLGVQRSYLEAAIDEMTREFGTIHGYFERGLGLDDQTLDRLSTELVERVESPKAIAQ